MYLFKNEKVDAFFLIKKCKIKEDEETAQRTIELTVISDVGKNSHKVLINDTPQNKEVCVLGSLVQIIGKTDNERKIIAEQILPAFATLPSLKIEVDTKTDMGEIISALKSKFNTFDYAPLSDIMHTILKSYEDDIVGLTKPCKLRGVNCPSELHAAYSLILSLESFCKNHTHINFEVLTALTMMRLLEPLRKNLFNFMEEMEWILPVHTAIFDAIMLREYASSDDFKI